MAAGLLAATVTAAEPADAFPKQPPVPYLSVEESLKRFQIQDGYRLEPVLTEPIIKEPVAIAFDGNGRMFVAEMRTYMQNIDGTGAHERTSRVSMHWSSKGDGVYDRHSVFADKLVLPRMILPVDGGLLINETDTLDIFLYRDTNGDGVSDSKQLVFAGGPRGGNLEHQQSGLIWSMDNWLYSTYNAWRLRLKGTNVVKEPTAPNGGQWGLTQDDHGKPWFVNAGGERGPLNFQQPIVYGAFNVNDQFAPGFAEVWPLVPIPDVQGGPIRFRPEEKTLNHFTATCGAEIYRGDRLPADLRGDLLFAEPVGRLIRRTKIEVRDGVTHLSNPYEKSEFIRSSDPNFRPVNMATAPDGSLYIVDMYRGIIQEGNWVREGSYLRKVVQQYSLDQNAGRGRIWRLTHPSFKPGPQPKLQDESAVQLVGRLEHPNGWWRDTAQKLLVLRHDPSAVEPLRRMARANQNHLARLHALWTLEGMDALEPALVRVKLKDEHPQLRIGAIRVAETLIKQGDTSLNADIRAMASDKDPNVVIQAMMTANLLKWPDAKAFIEQTMAAHLARGVKEIGTAMVAPRAPAPSARFTAAEKQLIQRGDAIYKELCFSCHGPDGKGSQLEGAPKGTTIAPSFTGSKTVNGAAEGMVKVILHGLTGPVAGKAYDALMVPMKDNDDTWIASVASYVRTSFGNKGSVIDAKTVAAIRKANSERTEPWTLEELAASMPRTLAFTSGWKLTASHNGAAAKAAFDGDLNSRYDTSASQTPGMWFQVELPETATLSGIQLDSTKSPGDYPRGYKVELSADGVNWGTSVATGKGSPVTDITFAPAKAKFIRITQTGAVDGLFWSIHEMQLLQPPLPFTAKPAAKKPANAFE